MDTNVDGTNSTDYLSAYCTSRTQVLPVSSAGLLIQPGRLWSLWDIMNKVDVGRLVQAVNAQRGFGLACQASFAREKAAILPVSNYKEIIERLDLIIEETKRLGLGNSFAVAQRLKDIATGPKIQFGANVVNAIGEQAVTFPIMETGRFADQSNELFLRLPDDLSLHHFLSVPFAKTEYWEQDNPLFGENVLAAFGAAADEEISEAGKCLAVERTTACVFHLMRAMEIAVAKLGETLQVTIIDKDNVDLSWGIIVNNMRVPVEAMAKGPEKNRWSETLSLLYHVSKAWRNDTMHPKKTYTESEAEGVFNAVRSFMINLAPMVRPP